jgi:arabinose-5-phosphate isomerase
MNDRPHPDSLNERELLALARDVLRMEAEAVAALADRMGEPFVQACRLVLECRGRVVVTGMGKSGMIARKIAATLASTGTPALFLHPAEGVHGDLGMVAAGDVVLALSYSGENDELMAILPVLKRLALGLIALTGSPRSTLAQHSEVVLDVSVPREACPHNLAPTSSTTAALALGDALALAVLDARGFSVEDFARSHPGGSLGRKLLTRVADVMRTGDAVPRVPQTATLAEAIVEMSAKGMGMTVVVGKEDKVAGVFTDGDLRRCLGRVGDAKSAHVAEVMTRAPRTIGAERLAADCVVLMETPPKIMSLLVVDDTGTLVGAVQMHDLFRARVV